MSCRALRIQAGASVMASRICCMPVGQPAGLGPALPGRAGLRRPGQVVQMGPLGLVQLQRVGDAVQDRIRRAGQVAALHPHVVVDADPGQQRDLLATQPLHPAVAAAVRRQAGLVRRQPGPPRDQEVADLRPLVGGSAGRSCPPP